MATLADAIADALNRLGVVAPGETPTAVMLSNGLSRLQTLNDVWAAERLMIPYILRTTGTITASKATYTVGTGGDIDLVRPAYLTGLGFIDTSPDPDLEISIPLMTDDEWRGTAFKALTSTLPAKAYYNPTYASGFGTLTPWPIPTSTTLQWALYSPVAVPQFTATSNTISYPPSWHEFIASTLAYKLALIYGVSSEVRDELRKEAERVKTILKRSNWRPSTLESPAAGMFSGDRGRGGYYGFLVGS